MLKSIPFLVQNRRYFITTAFPMYLLEKLKNTFIEHKPVAIKVNASQIKIVQEPSQFYKILIEKCLGAKNRIVIASLYLGTGPLEASIVAAIDQNLKTNPKLSVQVLLDCMRGSRGNKNSRTMLLPLLRQHSDNVKVSLYHTPKYRGLLKRFIPNRYNEIIGLQHMKLYLFDDDVIITGANLSNDYFTNRQDRYIVVNSCPQLGDFVSGLCSRVSDFSFQVSPDNQLVWDEANLVHPIRSQLEQFVEHARAHILGFYSAAMRNYSTDEEKDTVIYPLLEMGQLGIHQDSRTTRHLLETCSDQTEVRIATGYFNLTRSYADSIIHNSKAQYYLLMAHPTANGFFEAKGPAGGIPKGYSELAGRLYDRLIESKQNQRVRLLEYARQGWTFHAKGLWLSAGLNQPPCLTLIGSPNFGERSLHHDLECQFLIATTNPQLQEELQKECDNLYSNGLPYTSIERQRKPPFWVKMVLMFFKTYL